MILYFKQIWPLIGHGNHIFIRSIPNKQRLIVRLERKKMINSSNHSVKNKLPKKAIPIMAIEIWIWKEYEKRATRLNYAGNGPQSATLNGNPKRFIPPNYFYFLNNFSWLWMKKEKPPQVRLHFPPLLTKQSKENPLSKEAIYEELTHHHCSAKGSSTIETFPFAKKLTTYRHFHSFYFQILKMVRERRLLGSIGLSLSRFLQWSFILDTT